MVDKYPLEYSIAWFRLKSGKIVLGTMSPTGTVLQSLIDSETGELWTREVDEPAVAYMPLKNTVPSLRDPRWYPI